MTTTSDSPTIVDPFSGSQLQAATGGQKRHRRPAAAKQKPGRKNRRDVKPDNHMPEPDHKLKLREVDGHLMKTGTATWAWYRLPAQRWNFRANSDRTNAILSFADQLAELTGHWIHLRVTWRPVSPRAWAEAHDRLAVDRLPDTPGALSYQDYLVGEQKAIGARALMVKEVHVGVLVAERTATDRAVDKTPGPLRRVTRPLALSEAEEVAGRLAIIDQVMTGRGMDGWRSEPADIDWLLTRSVGLGLPAPTQKTPVAANLNADDLASYTDASRMWQEPYAPTTTVRAVTGELAGTTRHLAVMRVGLMTGLDIPERDMPWMVTGDRTGLPIEWSARFFIRSGDDVRNELQKQSDKVRAQVRHYLDEHKIQPPLQLARQAALATRIDDELTSGFTARGTRVEGWWSLAVAADSEDAAIDAVSQITNMYKPKVRIEHPEAQYAHAREFIPGEDVASAAYKRRGSVVWAAAAMPHVTSHVGDQQGVSLGETAGATRSPVAWDMWLSQTLDGSGLTGFTGDLGSGKSMFMFGCIYKSLRVGARWVVLDPSGPARRLTRIPELSNYSRHIDLLGSQTPGILNPYRVVSDPLREHFDDEPEPEVAYQLAMNLAATHRRQLMTDVLTGLLPYEVAHQPETRTAILRAIQAVPNADSPKQVLEVLKSDQTSTHDASQTVLGFVNEFMELLSPLMPRDDFDPYAEERDDRLTVLTMPGLVLPKDNTPRRDWQSEEQIGIQMLGLAAWLTKSIIYSQPMKARKGVALDEAHALSQVPTGRTLLKGFTRDSRKWKLRVFLGDQLPQGLAEIQGVHSLIDSSFTGRLKGEAEQRAALPLAGVPVGVGYEQVLAGFPKPTRDRGYVPREFLFADGAGGVERMRALLNAPHLAHVWDALNTRPATETRDDDDSVATALGEMLI